MAAGGYEPVAEKLFNQAPVDAFFLEYDSDRAGDFQPLTLVRKGTIAVLGLLTTKSGAVEDEEAIRGRLEEAGRVKPLEELAVSPQCGFASVAIGNPVTLEEQQAKLELVGRGRQGRLGAARQLEPRDKVRRHALESFDAARLGTGTEVARLVGPLLGTLAIVHAKVGLGGHRRHRRLLPRRNAREIDEGVGPEVALLRMVGLEKVHPWRRDRLEGAGDTGGAHGQLSSPVGRAGGDGMVGIEGIGGGVRDENVWSGLAQEIGEALEGGLRYHQRVVTEVECDQVGADRGGGRGALLAADPFDRLERLIGLVPQVPRLAPLAVRESDDRRAPPAFGVQRDRARRTPHEVRGMGTDDEDRSRSVPRPRRHPAIIGLS
jgi:hypothetical protein